MRNKATSSPANGVRVRGQTPAHQVALLERALRAATSTVEQDFWGYGATGALL